MIERWEPSSVPPKILGHEAAATRRNPSMSSVSYIETPQPEEALMNGTEEIRFKAGDACCRILRQDYDVGPVTTSTRHWSATTAGTHFKAKLGRAEQKRVSRGGDGRAVMKARLGSREA
ncbi:hypothetical protein SVAN01_00204 [Stagonosporopsis vannaccii]|nr:hypothetical protein SVAN01_00204 [Stagonosporopsis vannaccii]